MNHESSGISFAWGGSRDDNARHMPAINQLDRRLKRWTEAALIDSGTANKIKLFETERKHGSEWLVRVALSLGAIMIGAGVLLFVAAHWDTLSPTARFALVLTMVAGFHIAGAIATERFAMLGVVLHALGTVALGGGIFLAGQIFNLEEHWPGGVMLWALGAVVAWWVRRDAVQGIFAALLIPAWIWGEWAVRTERYTLSSLVLNEGLMMLAFAYLMAKRGGEDDSGFRRALTWLGAVALIPLAFAVIYSAEFRGYRASVEMGFGLRAVGIALAMVSAVGVAYLLRRREAWTVLVAVFWVLILGMLNIREVPQELAAYGWCGLGSVGLVAWGLRDSDKARINLGVLGFAVTVFAFYFSSVMDKLGRSVALIGFGVIFLIGGYELEKLRRKLVARVAGGGQ
jgi:MFS family permease